MIELLAPAKDKICAKAAVDFGADAIYIGASDFGARKNVPNSLSDIKEIVDYAHLFKVKVYVTINTILTDGELLKAKEMVEKLEEIGVDAIIVQDMGLAEVLSSSSSKLPIHASTQCDNRTVEKVKFLEDVGFSRVILARELSLEQIKEIREKTNVELEAFIHGALCVSYSGQCYLSYLVGGAKGRSANRGECAQPCRKKYSLVDEDGKHLAKDQYLLNLKDFNASKHLKRLAEAGVTSFKIEGRLKDENYVKNVVGYYRKLIDELGLGKTSSGNVTFDFEPNLEKSFNRGFTDYFLEERKECFSRLSPKSMGEYLGKIKQTGKNKSGNYFEIEPAKKIVGQALSLHPQDGLCFFVGGTLSGCLVNKVEGNKIFPNKMDGIKAGVEIYRNSDSEFEKQLKNSKTVRKISANVVFDKNFVKIIDEDGFSAGIQYKFEEFAQNREKMAENIETQFKKSGESCFSVQKVEVKTDKIPFLAVSKLNELRRELLENLKEERLKNYRITNPKTTPLGDVHYPQTQIDYRGNILNESAKEFYEKHGCRVVEMALESGVSGRGKMAMTTKHCLRYAFGICTKKVKNSPKSLFLVDEKGKRYLLKFNCKNCEMELYFGEKDVL